MTENTLDVKSNSLTIRIIIAMFFGVIVGLILQFLPHINWIDKYVTDGILSMGGELFLNLMKMLVVPVVLVSLTCGICSLENISKLGRIGTKSLLMFIGTTVFAIILSLIFANLFHLGYGVNLKSTDISFQHQAIPSLYNLIVNFVPSNPVEALANGNMLQIIVFAIFLGIAINASGAAGKNIADFFDHLNAVVMKMITILMWFAPYGIFCLISVLFAKFGFSLLTGLVDYFFTVILVLVVHTVFTYGMILKICKLRPMTFFRKIYPVVLFAFSVASSNASIPLTLDAVERKLGVGRSTTAFVVPLGMNINKNGTAIMQAVAAIFIAHAYGVDIGLVGNLIIVLTATLAAIGTGGVPSVGIIALIMVLRQLGLPIDGIALILGIDRLLDMLRTSVSVMGNAVIACAIGKSENDINLDIYASKADDR